MSILDGFTYGMQQLDGRINQYQRLTPPPPQRPETPWGLEKEKYLREKEKYLREIQEVRTSLSIVSEDYNSKDLYKYVDNIPIDELQRTTNKYTRNGWKIFNILPSVYEKSRFMICFENLNYTYNTKKELKL